MPAWRRRLQKAFPEFGPQLENVPSLVDALCLLKEYAASNRAESDRIAMRGRLAAAIRQVLRRAPLEFEKDVLSRFLVHLGADPFWRTALPAALPRARFSERQTLFRDLLPKPAYDALIAEYVSAELSIAS